MASNNTIPTIPPRPVRSKSPAALPVVPPRPSRAPKSAGPDPALESRTIPETTELQQPVPVSAAQQRPAPITKGSTASSNASSAAPSLYKLSNESTDNTAKATSKEGTGIPHIGRRVPMAPNAGDVQAPTPSATPSGGKKKHVYREEWEMDDGAYGSGKTKTPYSMSSVDLNAVVAHSESPGVGVHSDSMGVPDEELGYLAADEYVRAHSRAQSRSQSPVLERKIESPLAGRLSTDFHRDHGDVIHIDAPTHGAGYYRHGNPGDDDAPEKPVGEEKTDEDNTTDTIRDEVYSILAQDEVLKRQNRHMQAAITPRGGTPRSRPRSVVIEKDEADKSLDEKSARPSLDISAKSINRNSVRTPYEALSPAEEGARPLFPESDDEEAEDKTEPSNPAVANLRRPGLSEQRFPSNDVWEEAPDHAHLSATVNEPGEGNGQNDEEGEAPKEKHRRPSTTKEPQYVSGQPHYNYEPGDEREILDEYKPKKSDYEVNISQLPEDESLRRLIHTNNATGETPKSRQSRRKFPSKDVWEEAPESLDLEAEIEPTPIPEKERATTINISTLVSAPEGTPAAEPYARPTTSAPLEKTDTNTSSASVTSPSATTKPAIPARPTREKPSIPDRPKPKIPTRPAKPAILARAPSQETPSSIEKKEKPAPPPRVGGKIAALKAGLGDLESRLRLGPFGPKKEEPKEEEPKEEEKKVLEHATKGRARGPKRRAPTTAVKEETKVDEPNNEEEKKKKKEELGFSQVWTVFTLDDDLDAVVVEKITLSPEEEEKKEETNKESKEEENVEVEQPKEEKAEEPKEPAPSTEETAKAKSEPELPTAKEETETAPTTTTTLPSVTGTGAASEPAVTADSSSSDAPADSKPTAAEEGNPTLIPAAEHPEDAKIPAPAEVKEETEKQESEGGISVEEAKKEEIEAENKGVEGRKVAEV